VGLREEDWQLLLGRIRNGKCTPFLGAGACAGTLPTGWEIAQRWTERFEFPLKDVQDLARVAQFLGIHQDDAMFAKEQIARDFQNLGPPDFGVDGEPHSVLADLPLPLYLTTNYDDFMVQALRHRGKQPAREICRWNRSPSLAEAPVVLDPLTEPTPAQPVVFHLHGCLELPESLVLSEDDYLDFLVSVSRDDGLLPHQIKRALAGTSLLFIGYALADWDFRVIHRGLVMAAEQSLRRLSITVQLRPSAEAEDYLDKYFSAMSLRVYWGTAQAFMAELHQRWLADEQAA
jgi:SIR2-like domain